jgi:hypothetical protein
MVKRAGYLLLTWFYFINHARILIHTGVVSTDTALSFINHHDDCILENMNDNKKTGITSSLALGLGLLARVL